MFNYILVSNLLLITTSGPKYRTELTFFLERLRLRNMLLNDDIFDIFLDYPLVNR